MKWIESRASPRAAIARRGHPAPNRANGGSARFADGGAEAAGARPKRRAGRKTRQKYGRRYGCAILRRKWHPVRNIAYGFDPGLPHGGIGGFDGLCSLFGGEAFSHLRHGTGKPRKTAPFGDHPQQIGEFEVTVGIDQPRSEHPGIKLGAGTPVGLGTRPDGEDTAVGRNPDQGIAEQAPAVSKAG